MGGEACGGASAEGVDDEVAWFAGFGDKSFEEEGRFFGGMLALIDLNGGELEDIAIAGGYFWSVGHFGEEDEFVLMSPGEAGEGGFLVPDKRAD